MIIGLPHRSTVDNGPTAVQGLFFREIPTLVFLIDDGIVLVRPLLELIEVHSTALILLIALFAILL